MTNCCKDQPRKENLFGDRCQSGEWAANSLVHDMDLKIKSSDHCGNVRNFCHHFSYICGAKQVKGLVEVKRNYEIAIFAFFIFKNGRASFHSLVTNVSKPANLVFQKAEKRRFLQQIKSQSDGIKRHEHPQLIIPSTLFRFSALS